jgi:hypothetical protein
MKAQYAKTIRRIELSKGQPSAPPWELSLERLPVAAKELPLVPSLGPEEALALSTFKAETTLNWTLERS